MPNYYEILGVSPSADLKMIKSAYRTLMFKFRCHPDLGGDVERARTINEAYQTLSSQIKRAEYDNALDPGIFCRQSATGSDVNRRRVPRVEVNLIVSYQVRSGDTGKGKVMDLSSLGCRIRTDRPLKSDTNLIINIDGHIVSGKVRWQRMFHPSVFQRVHEAGVEFNQEFDGIDQL